ncbi:MAG: hypothetical protein RLZZ426_614, partial [Actinomycetota bacterium]
TVLIPKGFEPIGVVKRRLAADADQPLVTLDGVKIPGIPGHDHFR